MTARQRFCHLGTPLLFLALLLSACATARPPAREAFLEAERMIAEARRAGAEAEAPIDLGLAEERMEAARRALAAGEARASEEALAEALLAAELARARTKAALARAAVQAKQRENQLLRRELLGEGERR
jgi:hypothetical protein